MQKNKLGGLELIARLSQGMISQNKTPLRCSKGKKRLHGLYSLLGDSQCLSDFAAKFLTKNAQFLELFWISELHNFDTCKPVSKSTKKIPV